MADELLLDGVTVEQLQRLPWQDAIAWLREKVPMPTEAWDELWQEFQDYAFTVAGVTRAELLDDIQQQLIKAMEDGTGIHEWKRDFKKLASDRGWTPDPEAFAPWRVELILQQNLRNAYAAGRWQQINDPVVAKNRPYLMWRHRDSVNPRLAHLALDGKVFPLSDPLWKIAFPPCGFFCKCQAYTLSDREVREMGVEVGGFPEERVTIRDRLTGKEQQVPAVLDPETGKLHPVVEPGFAYVPGEKRMGAEWMEAAIARLSPQLQKQVREEVA